MKKLPITLALLSAFSAPAMAQQSSAVTVYGIADLGLVYENGGTSGSTTKLQSGVQSGSRLGFRGTEDLGNGLAAKFVLETGIAMDTGGFNQGGTAFARQAYAGLSGNFGSLTLGRQYSPLYLLIDDIDPFGTGMAGQATNLINADSASGAGGATRVNNAIKYTSPAFSGITGELLYGLGEVQGNNTALRQFGLSLGYGNGPLVVRVAHHQAEDAAGNDHSRQTMLGARYDFGPASVNAGYMDNKGLGIESRDYLIGATAPLGAGKFMISYIRKDDRTAADSDANQWALGYTYALSKRTNLYTAYAKIKNDNGATYTVGSATNGGSGDKAFNVGVRHAF